MKNAEAFSSNDKILTPLRTLNELLRFVIPKGNKEMPIYPKRSLKLGQEGVVYLKILISESGVSEQIEFLKKSQYPLLNK